MTPPWASLSLTPSEDKSELQDDPECLFLRHAAQILPRRYKEVVALGVSRPAKPKGDDESLCTVYACNSDQ